MNYKYGSRIYYQVCCITEENFDYGTCSKYLAYSIESQVVGFIIQTSVVKSFPR